MGNSPRVSFHPPISDCMPLNSHSYLVDQGWQGTGKALREGAISRPVVVAQRKSLAGVGKDRDEAFPFWDQCAYLHACARTYAKILNSVFTAAATSIKVKLYNDDGDEDTVSCPLVQAHTILTLCCQDTPQPSGSSTPLDRTSTGILSNKPQKVGLSALETPAASKSTGLGIMALAKRESARRGLYSRFFRGPVLGTDAEEPQVLEVAQRSPPPRSESNDQGRSGSITEKRKGKKRKSRGEDEGGTGVAQKKRKSERENETKEERKERRRLKKEAEKREVPEVMLDGEEDTWAAPEGSVRGAVGYSRKKDRKKKSSTRRWLN